MTPEAGAFGQRAAHLISPTHMAFGKVEQSSLIPMTDQGSVFLVFEELLQIN